MPHDKANGLLQFLTTGILKYTSEDTVLQLGDRSQYIGLSDIGKGLECLRSAVSDKAGLVRHPHYKDVPGFSQQELKAVLENK